MPRSQLLLRCLALPLLRNVPRFLGSGVRGAQPLLVEPQWSSLIIFYEDLDEEVYDYQIFALRAGDLGLEQENLMSGTGCVRSSKFVPDVVVGTSVLHNWSKDREQLVLAVCSVALLVDGAMMCNRLNVGVCVWKFYTCREDEFDLSRTFHKSKMAEKRSATPSQAQSGWKGQIKSSRAE